MLFLGRKNIGISGISALEYALLIAAVAAALVAMQLALRRAISARWKESIDTIGDGRQYEQGATSIVYR